MNQDMRDISESQAVSIENMDKPTLNFLDGLRINQFDVTFTVKQVMRYRLSSIFDPSYQITVRMMEGHPLSTEKDYDTISRNLNELYNRLPEEVNEKYSGYHPLKIMILTPEGDFFSMKY